MISTNGSVVDPNDWSELLKNFGFEIDQGLTLSLWLSEHLRRKNTYYQIAQWKTDRPLVELLSKVTPISFTEAPVRSQNKKGKAIYFLLDDCPTYIFKSDSSEVVCRITHTDRDHLDKVIKKIQKWLPAPGVPKNKQMPINFWTYSSHGPSNTNRSIEVTDWKDIQYNYSKETQRELGYLMNFTPSSGGQLILLSGFPGSGKTFSLRSLIWAWREWCEPHFIVDPDNFFGGRSDYMMDVLLGYDDYWEGPSAFGPMTDKWKLLILEDTGELLTTDAKEKVGQGLSRLLNVVDGFIGQGLKILILVTTNEELKKIHPAVSRPGRCAANIKFTNLSEEEIKSWCKVHNVQTDLKEATIAKLYSILRGEESESHVPLGFG